MTIKEFANEQGITPQAVYQRLKSAGIEISALKDAETGEITPAGADTIKAIFSNTSKQDDKENALKITRLQDELNKKAQELESFKTRVEELQQERDSWKETAKGLQDALKQAQTLAEKEQQTAQQAQALNMASIQAIQALRASPEERQRLTIWQRITAPFTGRNKTKEEDTAQH